MKFSVDELARSNTIDQLKKKGIKADFEKLNEKHYKDALLTKILKEASKASRSKTTDDLTENLSELLEVIDAVIKAYNISEVSLNLTKTQRKDTEGTFEEQIYIKSVEVQPNTPEAEFYLRNRELYPQLEF